MSVEPLLSKWEEKRLEELSSAIQYGYTAKATTERIGPKLLRITDIQNDAVDWNAVPFCEISARDIEKYRLGKNDLLFARTGATVGKSYLIPGSIPESVFASYLIRVRLLETVYPKYIAYFFRSGDYWRQITENQAGIGQPNVNGTKLAQIKIPVAPLSQQGLIVAEIEKQFSRLDEAVANLKRGKANLKRYKASLLKAAVEGKLTEAWRKQHPDIEPASKLLERILAERRAKWSEKGKRKEPACPNNANSRPLPKGWCWVTLDQTLWQLRSGTAETSARDPTDYPVLKSSAVRHGVIDYADLNYLQKSQSMRPENFLQHGDFLITRLSGSVDYVGCSALVKDIACDRIQYPDRIFCGKLVSGVDGTYLSYCFQHSSIRKALGTAAKSTAGHQRISMSDLYPLTLPLPPTAEQECIVAEVERRLSVIEELEATVKANLTRADRLRQAILTRVFKGGL